MLTRQKIWKPLLSVNPAYGEFANKWALQDPMSTHITSTLRITPENMYVAMQADRHGRHFAAMLAVPCQVHADACDDVVGASQHKRRMSVGYASALADTLNTNHIISNLLPSIQAHVTVNMQSQLCGSRDLVEGAKVVVVSSIRKMGKQLCFCTTDILHELDSPSPALVEEEAKIQSVVDLQHALRHYDTLFHNSHVKAFMKLNLDQGGRK